MSTPEPANLDEAITELKATETDENAAADLLITAYAAVPQRIADAVAAAQAAGATPAQLRGLATLNDSIAQEASRLRAALAAPVA